MKKFFMISALLTMVSFAHADNFIKVESPAEVPQGATGFIEVLYNFDKDNYFANYSFDIYLPAGVTLNTDKIVRGDCHSKYHPDAYTINYKEDEGCYALAIMSNPTTALTGTSGILVKLAVDVTADVALNTGLDASLKRIRFASTGGSTTVFDDITFKIKVVDYVTFDETATELPDVTGSQNVLVKRTIKAGQWNTICLPFAMTADQVTQAFGEAQLADFTGCTAEYADDSDYASSIKVNFQTVTAMEANRPYLIKVTTPVTYAEGFKVDGVTIDPVDDPVNAQDEVKIKVGANKYVYYYNSFYGTFVNNTEIPAGSIILSGNKFYYTKGTTTKGFRGWFVFDNCALDDIDLATAEVKIFIDDVTAIDGIGLQRIVEGVYDLSGRKIKIEGNDLNKLQKGVYIIDGKKVTIK